MLKIHSSKFSFFQPASAGPTGAATLAAIVMLSVSAAAAPPNRGGGAPAMPHAGGGGGGFAAPHVAAPQMHAPAAPAMAAPRMAAPQMRAAPQMAAPRITPGPHFGAAPRMSPGPHFGAAPRMSPGPHFGAAPRMNPGARFSAAPRIHGAPRFSGAPRIAHGPSSAHGVAHGPAVGPALARPNARTSPSVAGHAPAIRGAAPNLNHAFGPAGAAPREALRNAAHGGVTAAPSLHAVRSANAVHRALTTGPVRQALHSPGALRTPAARTLVASSLATAAWQGNNFHRGDFHGRDGWWRHRHGGFGWVGPVFWPFAYYDVYDYALWGYDYDPSFWDYGYTDLYAALFDPYGYDDLIGYAEYLPSYAGRRRINAYASIRADQRSAQATLAQMCGGDDQRDIAGLPTDAVAQRIDLTDEQRAALDDLASASAKAAQIVKDSCPKDVALTAPARIAAMQTRIEAMISAVQTVEPALDKFYGLLNDEQKARLNALAAEQRPAQRSETANAANQTGGDCSGASPGLTDWPSAEIDRMVKPNDEQRGYLEDLQNAAAKAADMLKNACQPSEALTPPARLAAADQRLQTLLAAVKTVRPPLERFYASLSDEQKANFDAIGPQRLSSTAEQTAPEPKVRHHRRRVHHGFNIERMIWRMMSMAR